MPIQVEGEVIITGTVLSFLGLPLARTCVLQVRSAAVRAPFCLLPVGFDSIMSLETALDSSMHRRQLVAGAYRGTQMSQHCEMDAGGTLSNVLGAGGPVAHRLVLA